MQSVMMCLMHICDISQTWLVLWKSATNHTQVQQNSHTSDDTLHANVSTHAVMVTVQCGEIDRRKILQLNKYNYENVVGLYK